MTNLTLKLLEFETRDIFPLSTRAPGVYEQKLSIQGNGLLSSLFVDSISDNATILVEYLDRTTGVDDGQYINLQAHPVLTSKQSSNIIITNFHDKPIVRCTITGGEARFGVCATAKNLSDLDANMVLSGQVALIEDYKNLLVGGYDDITNKFGYLPLENNAVRITGQVVPDKINSYPSGLNRAGRITVVSVNSETWTALPEFPLEKRNALCVQNVSGQIVKINYSPHTEGFVGIMMQDETERYYDITDSITIYAKCSFGSSSIVVEELS